MSDMSAEALIIQCGQDLGRNADQMRPIITAVVQEAWCETADALRELTPSQWSQLTFADPTGRRLPLPARLVARIQQRLAEQEKEEKAQKAPQLNTNPSDDEWTDSDDDEDRPQRPTFDEPRKPQRPTSIDEDEPQVFDKMSPDFFKARQGGAQAGLDDDDDCSTAVPSEVLEENESEVSVWDTGNLEDLGSCGVLSSAEIRAARLQRMGRTNKTKTQKSKASSSTQPFKPQASSVVAQQARPKPKPAVKGTPPAAQKASLGTAKPQEETPAPQKMRKPAVPRFAHPKTQAAEQAESSAAAAGPCPAARPQPAAAPAPKVHQVTRMQSAPAPQAVRKPKPVELSSSCASASTSASTSASASAGYPKSQDPNRPLESHELKCHLDKHSREQIREMGLWEYMPARNPVVTRAGPMGADWNVGFEDFQHTLGGVPDPNPCGEDKPAMSAEAINIQKQLDKQSREALKEMGLWEHMPCRNPVVTRSGPMGAHWHQGFGEYQHTLGGVPTPLPTDPEKKMTIHPDIKKTPMYNKYEPP